MGQRERLAGWEVRSRARMEESTSHLQKTQSFVKTVAHDMDDRIGFQKNYAILVPWVLSER